MDLAAVLFADLDVGAIIKIVLFLLVFAAAAISQLLTKIRQMPPPANRPNPPPVPRDVADEIETFMRRAAERKTIRKPRPIVLEEPRPVAEPVRAEVVVAKQPVGGNVSQHVAQYLDEQEFRRRENQLGSEIAQADEQINQRLHNVFDHRVSELESVGGEAAKPPTAVYEPPDLVGATAEAPDSFAAGLLDLMASPESLRQAIILSEILHRPEHHWASPSE